MEVRLNPCFIILLFCALGITAQRVGRALVAPSSTRRDGTGLQPVSSAGKQRMGSVRQVPEPHSPLPSAGCLPQLTQTPARCARRWAHTHVCPQVPGLSQGYLGGPGLPRSTAAPGSLLERRASPRASGHMRVHAGLHHTPIHAHTGRRSGCGTHPPMAPGRGWGVPAAAGAVTTPLLGYSQPGLPPQSCTPPSATPQFASTQAGSARISR